jgi:hypothetical protein
MKLRRNAQALSKIIVILKLKYFFVAVLEGTEVETTYS